MMGFGFGGLGAVYMLVFWVIIIALAVWVLSRLFPRGADDGSYDAPTRRSNAAESALEILQKRYARGEISRDEYEEMRRDLNR